jgi:hypothetical protein
MNAVLAPPTTVMFLGHIIFYSNNDGNIGKNYKKAVTLYLISVSSV